MHEQKKPQKIVLLLGYEPGEQGILHYGLQLARLFKKDLLIVNSANEKKREAEEWSAWKERCRSFLDDANIKLGFDFLDQLPDQNNICNYLADELEAIVLVSDSKGFRKHSRSFAHSPIPFFLINPESETKMEVKQVFLGVDRHKHSLEAAIWASNFGKFTEAEISVIAAKHNKEKDEKQVTKNAVLAKKLFTKLEIPHKLVKGRESSWRNTDEALEQALKQNADVFVFTGSLTITWLDRILGIPEIRILKKTGELPALIVNPRVDNYMLCDGEGTYREE